MRVLIILSVLHTSVDLEALAIQILLLILCEIKTSLERLRKKPGRLPLSHQDLQGD